MPTVDTKIVQNLRSKRLALSITGRARTCLDHCPPYSSAADVGLHAVANERRHRDATVLDLRVAQEADRRLLALVPELTASEVQRVPVPLFQRSPPLLPFVP